MDYKIYQNQLSQVSARFNLMVCLVFGLLLSNIILSAFVWISFRHHTIEITPFSERSSYLKSASFIDAHYLSLMSENFINERLNVSPETVDANHARLLSFINPKQYSYFLKLLLQEAGLIKNKTMSSQFDITDILVDANHLTAKVTGRLKRYVGIQNIDDLQKIYKLRFNYSNGRLSIVQFASEKERAHV